MYKVMIVDDMEIFRRDIKRLKVWGECSGFSIIEEAADGIEAIKKLESNPMDLIITDIKMPRMDGIELLKVISEKKLCPYVVLLSDYTEYTYARQGFVYGAFDYIGKPVESKEITDLLERIKMQLQEKEQEEQKLLELQDIIEDAFINIPDIQLIIDSIGQGDIKARALTEELLDMLTERIHTDKNKVLLTLKNTIYEVINEVIKQHPWLPLYSEINLFYNVNYMNSFDWLDIKERVMKGVERLLAYMNQFIPNQDNQIVKGTCKYILENMDEKLSVQQVAEKLFISKTHLSETFKQRTGMTILEYTTMAKMERAKKMLMEGQLKNYEVAYQLGFRDNEYFNKVFKKHFGMSLSEFRQTK